MIALRDGLGLPGMAVLQFAFSPSPRSTMVPYLLRRNVVVYTGTHDNNTTLGWYLGDAPPQEKDFVRRYLGTDGHEIHWDMIRLALSTVADLAVVPHQDIAGLGGDCRMNTPATAKGNWQFRLTDWMLSEPLRDRLAGPGLGLRTRGRARPGGAHSAARALARWRSASITPGITESSTIATMTSEKLRRTIGMLPK